jgi:ribosomal-protein-alanine N-acetyltransferase
MGELSRRDVESGLGWKYTPDRLRRLSRDPTRNVVVARTGTTMAGFGIMTYAENTANLDLLAVKPRYHRRGIARQVVEWLEAAAVTAGISIIYVQVRKTNSGAIRFYETCGYQAIEELSGYYHGKENATLLSKNIRDFSDSV